MRNQSVPLPSAQTNLSFARKYTNHQQLREAEFNNINPYNNLVNEESDLLSEDDAHQNEKDQDPFSIGQSKKLSPYLYHTQGSSQTKEKIFNFQGQFQQREVSGQNKLLFAHSSSTTHSNYNTNQIKSSQLKFQAPENGRDSLLLDNLEFNTEEFRSPQVTKINKNSKITSSTPFKSNLSSLPEVTQTQNHRSSLSSTAALKQNNIIQYNQSQASAGQYLPPTGSTYSFQNPSRRLYSQNKVHELNQQMQDASSKKHLIIKSTDLTNTKATNSNVNSVSNYQNKMSVNSNFELLKNSQQNRNRKIDSNKDGNYTIAEQFKKLIMQQTQQERVQKSQENPNQQTRQRQITSHNSRPSSNQVITNYADADLDDSSILRSGIVGNGVTVAQQIQNNHSSTPNNTKNIQNKTNQFAQSRAKQKNQTPNLKSRINDKPLTTEQEDDKQESSQLISILKQAGRDPVQDENNLIQLTQQTQIKESSSNGFYTQPQHIRRFLSNKRNRQTEASQGHILSNSDEPDANMISNSQLFSEEETKKRLRELQSQGMQISKQNDIQGMLRKKHLKLRSKTTKIGKQISNEITPTDTKVDEPVKSSFKNANNLNQAAPLQTQNSVKQQHLDQIEETQLSVESYLTNLESATQIPQFQRERQLQGRKSENGSVNKRVNSGQQFLHILNETNQTDSSKDSRAIIQVRGQNENGNHNDQLKNRKSQKLEKFYQQAYSQAMSKQQIQQSDILSNQVGPPKQNLLGIQLPLVQVKNSQSTKSQHKEIQDKTDKNRSAAQNLHQLLLMQQMLQQASPSNIGENSQQPKSKQLRRNILQGNVHSLNKVNQTEDKSKLQPQCINENTIKKDFNSEQNNEHSVSFAKDNQQHISTSKIREIPLKNLHIASVLSMDHKEQDNDKINEDQQLEKSRILVDDQYFSTQVNDYDINDKPSSKQQVELYLGQFSGEIRIPLPSTQNYQSDSSGYSNTQDDSREDKKSVYQNLSLKDKQTSEQSYQQSSKDQNNLNANKKLQNYKVIEISQKDLLSSTFKRTDLADQEQDEEIVEKKSPSPNKYLINQRDTAYNNNNSHSQTRHSVQLTQQNSIKLTKRASQFHSQNNSQPQSRLLHIKPTTKNLGQLEEKFSITPMLRPEKLYGTGSNLLEVQQSMNIPNNSPSVYDERRAQTTNIQKHAASIPLNSKNEVLVNMNMAPNKAEARNQMLSSFKQSVLSISKIGMSQGQPSIQINSNNSTISPNKQNVKNVTSLNSPMIQLNKKSLLSRRIPTNEKCVPPKTPEKYGVSKRLVFRRRDRMRDKNLIIIYYDGVMGDTSYSVSYNNLRLRYGSFNGLRRLYSWFQVVIVMPYVTKRAKVIANYIEKHQGCPADAIYTLRQKQLGKTKDKWFRYQQIFEDFEIDDEEKVISNVLLVASYLKEVYEKSEFD